MAGTREHTSAIFPFSIGTIVGIMAAILGVGGGFIMVPAMIYIIGMPTIVAIGTDLGAMYDPYDSVMQSPSDFLKLTELLLRRGFTPEAIA